jgi:antitoxin (DNA-binding transcriptional repressor) of toxin-antitoxin stability system
MEFVITDRGRPVGRIIPIRKAGPDLEDLIRDLESRGMLEERRSRVTRLHPPLPARGDIAQKMLREDRG